MAANAMSGRVEATRYMRHPTKRWYLVFKSASDTSGNEVIEAVGSGVEAKGVDAGRQEVIFQSVSSPVTYI